MVWCLRVSLVYALLAVVHGQKILLTNDDGWAVANIRAQDAALMSAGYQVIVSAPADNESGTGSNDAPPTQVGANGCEFNSCPPNSPPAGSDPNDPYLNYVNSFPVTAVRHGIQILLPQLFGGAAPDFVVSGPNVGNNLGPSVVGGSGTVGAACEAAKEGIPAIVLSGDGGAQVPYTTLNTSSPSTTAALIDADLGFKITHVLLTSSMPILPPNIVLNVNFAKPSNSCADAEECRFVLTRIADAASSTPPDVEMCGSTRLPTESSVISLGCTASVSVMNATTMADVDESTQEIVLEKLSLILTCA